MNKYYIPLIALFIFMFCFVTISSAETFNIKITPSYDGYVSSTPYQRNDDNNYLEFESIGTRLKNAFIEFNLSDIPDYATITKVSLTWEGYDDYDVGGVSTWVTKIYSLENQPSVQPDNSTGNAVIWNDCEDGTMYLDSWINRLFGNTGQVHTANHTSSDPRLIWDNSPVSDVQAALVNNWFAIGVIGFDNQDSKCHSSESPVANPAPTLWVEYQANPPEISNESPEDESYDVELQPTTCIDVVTPTGTPLNITWKWWNGSGWEQYGENNSVANGTYCQDFNNATTPCHVYYWWVYVEEDGGVNYTAETFEFSTTCLGPPTNLSCSEISPGLINVTWDKFVNESGEMYTVIRWATQGIPPLWNEGTLAYNGTGNYTNIYIGNGACAAISAWSYFNDSGNWSLSSRTTKICCSGGGNYTICFRYENSTLVDGYNNPINFSKYPHSAHKLTIHFLDLTNQTYYLGPDWYNDSWGSWNVNAQRTCLNLSVDRDVLYFSFHWNWSINTTANTNTTCSYIRKLTPNSGQYIYTNKTITFYLTTHLHVYNQPYLLLEPGSDGNWSNSSVTILRETDFENTLVQYHYTINDETGLFLGALPFASYSSIYTYNRSGLKIVIDEQYIDTADKIYPYLVYEYDYFIGFHTTDYHRWNNGDVPNKQVIDEVITIRAYSNQTKYLAGLFNFDYDWYDGDIGLSATYSDVDFQTESVKLEIRYYIPGEGPSDIVYQKTVVTNAYEYTFNYPAANHSRTYYLTFTIVHPELQYFYEDSTLTVNFILMPGINMTVSREVIDAIFYNVLGACPLYDGVTGEALPWSFLILFGILGCVTLGLSKQHYSLSFLGSGVTGIFLSLYIIGLPTTDSGVGVLLVSSFFLAILGVFAMIKKEED